MKVILNGMDMHKPKLLTPKTHAEKMLLKSIKARRCEIGIRAPDLALDSNKIRADFLKVILCNFEVSLSGFYIEGFLDLHSILLNHGLELINCRFDTGVSLQCADVRGDINFSGCHMAGVNAVQLSCRGSVYFNKKSSDVNFFNSFESMGWLDFSYSEIHGNFHIVKSHLNNGIIFNSSKLLGLLWIDEVSICNESSLQVSYSFLGDVIITDLVCNEEVVFIASSILNGVVIKNGNNDGDIKAINFSNANIRKNFSIDGGNYNRVNLWSIKVDENLLISNAIIGLDNSLEALSVSSANIGGSVYIRNANFHGGVSFNQSKIKSNLYLMNVSINNISDLICDDYLRKNQGAINDSLMVNSTKIDGLLHIEESIIVGGISLEHVQIKSKICFYEVKIHGGDYSIKLDYANIIESVEIYQSSIFGMFSFYNSTVNNFTLSKSIIESNYRVAFLARDSKIKGSLSLPSKFKSYGCVIDMSRASIQKDLLFQGAEICSIDSDDFDGCYSICLDNVNVEGGFFFRDLISPVNGVSLFNSSIGVLCDDEFSWGEGNNLNGLIYERFYGEIYGKNNERKPVPIDAESRLVWIDKQQEKYSGANFNGEFFCPQPWQQLQKTLSVMGHDEESIKVGVSYIRRQQKIKLKKLKSISLTTPRELASIIFMGIYGALCGYGYRPVRLFYILFAIWAFGTSIYSVGMKYDVFSPTDPRIYMSSNYQFCQREPDICSVVGVNKIPNEYTSFNSFIY
jgi:hypothetical protein